MQDQEQNIRGLCDLTLQIQKYEKYKIYLKIRKFLETFENKVFFQIRFLDAWQRWKFWSNFLKVYN